MQIRSIHLLRFRGVRDSAVLDCAGLNVLIGKNNAGKSTVLNAIELTLDRIGSGQVAARLGRDRPKDEFFNRETGKPFEIGITFDIDEATSSAFRSMIANESPVIKDAILADAGSGALSVIIRGIYSGEQIIVGVAEICLGTLINTDNCLETNGQTVVRMSNDALVELADKEIKTSRIRRDLAALEVRDSFEYAYREFSSQPKSQMGARRARETYLRNSFSSDAASKIDQMMTDATDFNAFSAQLSQYAVSLSADVDEIENTELSSAITILSGSTYKLPQYVHAILKTLSSNVVQSFKELRSPIGRDEAVQLMRLKTKRGGSADLARIQETVKSLLGVKIDAFEPEEPVRPRAALRQLSPGAEMDIDDFLVEANGSGIREALRIILDLELKSPSFALIEEPEVHLHPGLERVLHGYLISKSLTMQLFVATHSANFLDATARQNVYLTKRTKSSATQIEKIADENDLHKISEDIGLRPSTVLMFDRLLFVEGPSDQTILMQLAKACKFEAIAANTAVVSMGGSTRFNHFAAETTLDLLSRRQIDLIFLLDRDEKAPEEIKKIVDRVGARAKVIVLKKREIENYILNPAAVSAAITDKGVHCKPPVAVSADEIKTLIERVATEGKERVLHLLSTKKVLAPIYLNQFEGSITQRIEGAKDELASRLTSLEQTEANILAEIDRDWPASALDIVPGSYIPEKVYEECGLRYNKDSDGGKISSYLNPDQIDTDLKSILRLGFGV